MKKMLFALVSGLGLAFSAAIVYDRLQRAGRRAARLSALDLNQATREQLLGLGLDPELADRIVENRPYRSKLDLLSRIVVPPNVYAGIKKRLYVDSRSASEPVKIATA